VHDPTSRLIVAKVNEIAIGMGGVCVAEGIETAAMLAVVRHLGVRLGQGHHLARPMPSADLERFVGALDKAESTNLAG